MSSSEDERSELSFLLQDESSRAQYMSDASQRSVTPAEELINQDWYDTLRSTFFTQWEYICELYGGSWRRNIQAIFACICLPCSALNRALNERQTHFKQSGIVYLYIYLGVTVVLNLVVALKNIHITTTEIIQKYFVLISMLVAVIWMMYLLLCIYQTVVFPETRRKPLHIFYKGGIYVFGLLSLGYSICIVTDYIACEQILDAVVAVARSLFIIWQIWFLHYFYGAQIPGNTLHIHLIMAHLLGTNLALWFWTLCSEEADDFLKSKGCGDYPVPLHSSRNYFSPLFVEYLLLAASLLYQIWKDLLPTRSSPVHHCSTCSCHVIRYRNMYENIDPDIESTRNNTTSSSADGTRARRRNPNSGVGFLISACFAVFFLVLVILSKLTGSSHQGYHIAYEIGIFFLYLSQICACYICQLSLQSHERHPRRHNSERFVPDHEDILLYLSLVGIVLWEGFHLYTLILDGLNYGSEVFDAVTDTLAITQHLFQTTTLVNMRRHQRTRGHHSSWLRECALFLAVTNFTLWIQDSFLMEVVITTPGERCNKLQYDLATVGYIIYPLSIFFRFHSGICSIIAWSIFDKKE